MNRTGEITLELYQNPIEPREPELRLIITDEKGRQIAALLSYKQAREVSFSMACLLAEGREMGMRRPPRQKPQEPAPEPFWTRLAGWLTNPRGSL